MNGQRDAHITHIGIMGCGAIGSRIAESVEKSFSSFARLSGIYDLDPRKTEFLSQKLKQPQLVTSSLDQLLDGADLIVEAVHADNTPDLLQQILENGKDVLVMSVGKLLGANHLFETARTAGRRIIVPSGAVAGIDAVRAAAIAGIETITLTTCKPPASLEGAPYLAARNISISSITGETTIFEGGVHDAVAAFPQNINVAAAVALASNAHDKLRIRIVSSPEFRYNRHEIHVTGAFGQITTITENLACPDNPKTSYLAVLSGIEALRSFCQTTKIGT